jgi:undecaprenyl-diphosphatase
MHANARRVRLLLQARNVRAKHIVDPLPPGHRPQDIFAALLLTAGVAFVLFDVPSYPWVQSLPEDYRAFFASFTDLGKSNWILIPTGVFCLFMLMVDWSQLAYRIKMAATILWTYAAFIFFVVAASGLIVLALKWSLGRARPKLYETVGPTGIDFLAFSQSFTSFPSGHATTVGAFCTALALLFPKWLWLIAVAGFWVAISRTMVGSHYPSDVLAGLLLGITVTLYSARWMARRRIGFTLTERGAISPMVHKRSFRICARALWDALLGRRPVKRVSVPADINTGDMSQS